MKICSLYLGLALSLVAAKQVTAVEPARPNILFFYVDDMGWGSIGPNGQADRKAKNLPSVRTPNLDRLAAQGVNFTRGYGCHVCSPARSSLQTGFHQGHTFADRNDPDNAKKAMRADDVLIGDALSAAGYVNGYWGKWGYGGSKDRISPVIENVQTLPTSHGYTHVLAELHHVRAHTFFQPTLWSAPAAHSAVGGLELIPNSMKRYTNYTAYPKFPALQGHADYPETAYCDDAYAFAALDFVRTQGQSYNKSGQPFFGLLAVQIPHAPFGEIATLPEWNKAYEDDPHYASLADQTRQWAAMVTRIDAHFGNLLAALEDPNNDGDTSDSIADNTLVLFQSDNGGPSGKNNVELDANGGLSGNKGKIQEGGIRVPLVMRWPAKITADTVLRAGTDCDMVVDVTDLLPTFCELAGAPIPIGIDGVSIAPTLLGSGHQRRREFIIHEASNGQSIIRGNHKLVRSKNSPLKLYDLQADRAEANDIAADHPELVQQLESLLLGERVAEPKGFANTYHRWTGDKGATTSSPENWSDYKYANAGITYMEDSGPPQLSWTARIENTSAQASTAHADADLEVLGLEVRGNVGKNARQSLVLDRGINLVGRNEIRLNSHATLTVNHGSVSSLRWIDVYPDAMLDGQGAINAIIYNGGTVAVTGTDKPTLSVNGDYHQSSDATLNLTITGSKKPAFDGRGEARLGGLLGAVTAEGFEPTPGVPFPVLTAERISGRFANSDNEVVAGDGSRFAIGYSESAVTLTAKPAFSEVAGQVGSEENRERGSRNENSKPSTLNVADKPNVLFIAVDDLNDWIGCLGGHPQATTPNIDRLAASGMLFTNAHCPAPACNPSRGAIMTGISPHVSGLYDNRQKMRELLPDAELLPKYFSRHGYWSAGSGKILHYFIDAQSWDEYFPAKETEDPFPRTLYPQDRPVNLPVGGPWQYKETDWAALDATDEEFGGDWLVSKWIGEQLEKEHDKPFFLACGIYRPHEPWFVPKKYFDPFPIEEIQLPPGYRENDLDDLPPAGQRRGPNRYFAHIREHGQWKKGIQGYLASIAFADAMIGRVLEALERGPNRDNTIVLLWSDHGWHLGEKQHWQKFTAWRVCTRVPLIVRVPAGTPGLPQGTQAGTTCDEPVNLLSLYPTLTQLAGLPDKQTNDGPSLVPLLEDPDGSWPHVSITYLGKPGNYGLSDKRWRYIEYDNGDHELYDIESDRYEWQNLAAKPEHAEQIARLETQAPTTFAKFVPASDASLPKLKWCPADDTATPASKPDGGLFDVVFTNGRDAPVKIHWMDRQGERKSYGTLQAGWRKPYKTRPGAVWLITDDEENPLGYFVVGDRTAHAIVPAR